MGTYNISPPKACLKMMFLLPTRICYLFGVYHLPHFTKNGFFVDVGVSKQRGLFSQKDVCWFWQAVEKSITQLAVYADVHIYHIPLTNLNNLLYQVSKISATFDQNHPLIPWIFLFFVIQGSLSSLTWHQNHAAFDP